MLLFMGGKLPPMYDVRETNASLIRDLLRLMLRQRLSNAVDRGALEIRRVLFFVPRVMIFRDTRPEKPARIPPGIEHDSVAERLPRCGYHDTVVLAPRAFVGSGPVQLQCAEVQDVKLAHEIFGPLVTEAPFSHTDVDQKILQMR